MCRRVCRASVYVSLNQPVSLRMHCIMLQAPHHEVSAKSVELLVQPHNIYAKYIFECTSALMKHL